MTPEMIARMAAIKAQREATGQNVHFINQSGERDVFSFNSVTRAEAFKAQLVRNGQEILTA